MSIESDFVNTDELFKVLQENPQVFEPTKKFLFVSEEGDDIFDNDDWYTVYTTEIDGYEAGTIALGDIEAYDPKLKNVLRFSEVENAQHASVMYKKEFSISDLLRHCKNGKISYRLLVEEI